MDIKNQLKYLFVILFLSAGAWCNAQPQAYIQIIHNCADPALDTIDLYYNGVPIDTPMLFRTGFPGSGGGLDPVKADTFVAITVLRKHSNGSPDSIYQTFYLDSFAADQRYTLIISGVFYTDSFAPNPNGRNIGLSLAVVGGIDSIARSDSVAAFKFFQGATDLPKVQALERITRQQLIDSSLYDAYDSLPSDSNPYTAHDSLPHRLYEFQLLSPDTSQNYGTYEVDFTNDEEQTLVMFTSGFLNPAKNDSGPALGLFGVFLNGAIVQFPTKTSTLQLLHNSPDTSLDSVDVYINGSFPDTIPLTFRTATTAATMYSYAKYNIGIAKKGAATTFWDTSLTFQPDTFYIATMSGLLNAAGYAPNPNGLSTAFDVLLKTPAEYNASSGSNFDFYMVNGIPDAGVLYLTPQGGPTICDSVLYNTQTNYVSLPGQSYPLTLTDSTNGNGIYVGTYFANFLAFTGQSAVLLASGFITPSANNNGPSAGLYMSPIAGGPFIPLFIYTSISGPTANSNIRIYPNPADNVFFVHLQQPQTAIIQIRLYDISGQTVNDFHFSAPDNESETIPVDVSNINDGLYILQLTSKGETANYKLVIAR